jgi:hypothetical protein
LSFQIFCQLLGCVENPRANAHITQPSSNTLGADHRWFHAEMPCRIAPIQKRWQSRILMLVWVFHVAAGLIE